MPFRLQRSCSADLGLPGRDRRTYLYLLLGCIFPPCRRSSPHLPHAAPGTKVPDPKASPLMLSSKPQLTEMTQRHPQKARVSPLTVTLRKEKRGGERLRQPTPRRPALRSPRPPSPHPRARCRQTPPPAARRGPGPPQRLPARAHLGRREGLSPAEQGSDRRSRRRPEALDPARPRGARRCWPSPRAAARRRVAGRCPALLLSHSALSHSLSLFLRAGEPGSNIRASPPAERRN